MPYLVKPLGVNKHFSEFSVAGYLVIAADKLSGVWPSSRVGVVSGMRVAVPLLVVDALKFR